MGATAGSAAAPWAAASGAGSGGPWGGPGAGCAAAAAAAASGAGPGAACVDVRGVHAYQVRVWLGGLTARLVSADQLHLRCAGAGVAPPLGRPPCPLLLPRKCRRDLAASREGKCVRIKARGANPTWVTLGAPCKRPGRCGAEEDRSRSGYADLTGGGGSRASEGRPLRGPHLGGHRGRERKRRGQKTLLRHATLQPTCFPSAAAAAAAADQHSRVLFQ